MKATAAEPLPNSPEFTVSELSSALKRTVEDAYGHVRVRGEISGFRGPHSSGHCYFALKDDSAKIEAVIWKGVHGRMRFKPQEGLEVIATGKLTTYPNSSKYQIVIEALEPAGIGALMALMEERKKKLAAEGLFDEARKQLLPWLPEVIGVVTSPTGAVIRDILHRLRDRFPRKVLVWPVAVQGKASAAEVAAAIRGFNAMTPGGALPRPDLLIVARGGGSIEDLWSFNEEVVVRAIADCPIPTISAVGHETDTTLADYAADRRAPTPTAAAEMAVPVRAELAAALADFEARKKRAILRPVQLGRERLQARADRLPKREALLEPHAQRLDDLAERLRRGLRDRAAQGRERLSNLRLAPAVLERNLREAQRALAGQKLAPALVERPLAERRERLAALGRLAEQLHPDRPLARGYVRVTDSDGRTITDRAGAAREAALTLKFRDGDLDVSTGGVAAPAAPRRKPAKPGTAPKQQDLFG